MWPLRCFLTNFIVSTLLILAPKAQSRFLKCEQNLNCNQSEVPSCCLISSTAVINDVDSIFREPKNLEMERIVFEANEKIIFLPISVQNRFPNVTTYLAKNCAIVEISMKNFFKLTKLKSLDLSSNQITSLKNRTFHGLHSLEKIHLGGNRIRAIASGSFEGTTSLLKVDLTGNVCIDGAFSETELEDALTTECKLQPHVTRADALFDWSCGSSFRESALISHIISGNLRGGSPGYWDFLAALYYKAPSVGGQFFCAATVISDRHFLSAAHCIQPKSANFKMEPENIVAVLGQRHLSERLLRDLSETFELEKIFVHENWNSSEVRYSADIAVLVTKESIFSNSDSPTVCLTKNRLINEYDFGMVMGWGDGREGPPYEGTMRAVTIRSVSTEECFIKDYHLGVLFARSMFCAGGEGEGPCKGASGGGFFVRVSGLWFLRGIVSSAMLHSDGSCNVNRYTLYTRVSDYADWIKGIVDQKFKVIETTTSVPATAQALEVNDAWSWP